MYVYTLTCTSRETRRFVENISSYFTRTRLSFIVEFLSSVPNSIFQPILRPQFSTRYPALALRRGVHEVAYIYAHVAYVTYRLDLRAFTCTGQRTRREDTCYSTRERERERERNLLRTRDVFLLSSRAKYADYDLSLALR